MDMKIRTMAALLGIWLAESRRSSALLLSVLLCLGATSASAVTWDYEPGTGTITGFSGIGSKTVTQVNTAAGEPLRAVSVNDNMGGTAVSGSTPFAGSDSLFSSANYFGETSVTFSLVSGKQFDLTSIAFTEFFAISETITLTSSKGTASYFLSAGGSATFNVAGDANAAKMQGITSFTVTASPTFFAIGFDNIVLVNITSPASAPTATTGAASSISATGATLNGTVNGNGASTTVTYDYGLTTGYGTNVAATTGGTVSAGAGSTATSVAITGLSCNTTYHFRVKGVNSAGTTNGSDASFTTSKCPQTITFNNPGAQNFGTTPTLSATSTSGLTVSFTSSTTGVCTITSGGALTFVTTGTCTINADQAGNGAYLAAATVSRSFSINAIVPGTPTIGTATGGNAQASITFSAPASNGGAAITGYTVTSSPGGHTGTGASSPITVTGLTNGTAYTFTVTATNNVGTGSASAASNSVTPATLPGAPTIGTATAGDTQASISFSAPASNGGASITGYTVTSSPGGLTSTGASSPIIVTGLTNGTAYTFTVTATNSAGTGSASSASNSVTPQGTQTITFANPGAQNFGTTPTLTATSDSGLTVGFTSSTTGVCTITTGGALTFVTAGTCTIDADQPGNGSYLAAPQVSRSFTVNAVVPGAPTGLAATAGEAQATVSFTAPVFTGGAAITSYTVTSSPGGMTATGPSSPLTVTGLTDGTAYTFTAVATNSAGDSAASAPSNSVTPVSGPEVTPPADIDVDAVGLFTPVDIGTATAEGGITATVTQVNGQSVTAKPTHFRPGANTVIWSATDGASRTGTAVQRVNVTPLVDFSKSQISAEGSTATIKVILNGAAVSYPVTVPYTVGGTASIDGSDHDLIDGSVTINSPDLEAAVSVHFVNDGAGEGTETLVLTMGTPTHAVPGLVKTHTIEINEGNVAPTAVLSADQGSGTTRLIGQSNGMVTVTTAVTDPNVGDTHSYDWSGTDNALVDLDAVPGTFTFDPAGLTPGLYKFKVAVSDGGGGNAELLLKIEAVLPVLAAVDSDGDGVNDDVEGHGDSDSDGVPDYLDNAGLARNVVQEKQTTATQYLMETEPGLFISLGQVAMHAGAKVGVSDAEVQSHANDGAGALPDEGQTFSGGLFDFDISELPVAGQQVKVVLSQFAAIPADAVYRKLLPTGWQDFVVDANNHIASAAGAAGYCPPPGDSAYITGLTEGHWCVQLTIQDGGPNDADGVADRRIKDPGGVGQQTDQPITIVITGGGGGALSYWLLSILAMALLMRGNGRRRWLMLPLALIGTSVQAETSLTSLKPAYVGVSYLAVKSDERSADFEAEFSALSLTADVTQTDLSRDGWSPYIGYQVHKHAAFEFGYVDLGEVTTTISGATSDVNSYLATASAVHPVTASGWTFNVVMRKAMHERIDGIFKLGVLAWKADYTLASATASRKFSDSGVSGNLGIGLELAATPYLPVRLGWNTYRFAGANVYAWELGVGYRF